MGLHKLILNSLAISTTARAVLGAGTGGRGALSRLHYRNASLLGSASLPYLQTCSSASSFNRYHLQDQLCPARSIPYSRGIMTTTKQQQQQDSNAAPWDSTKFPYPKARREEHYDTYKSNSKGDVKVQDAYRWLEEPPNKSKETEQFVEAQAELTQKYLAQDSNREALREKLTENWNFPRCESTLSALCGVLAICHIRLTMHSFGTDTEAC